ncbi:MAG: ComF family protein [bacterium]|nr:ComF family protein [bacterium]
MFNPKNWGECLLEMIYPEHCCLCDQARGVVPWCAEGSHHCGLHFFDGPHLCLNCFDKLRTRPSVAAVLNLPGQDPVTVVAGHWTHPDLVNLVGLWKYHGIRGLVWPLSKILVTAVEYQKIILEPSIEILWVPLPLHNGRKRERGFNQAEMLGRQLAANLGGTVICDLVVRLKNTGQQAKLELAGERADNLRDAFGPGKGLAKLVGRKNAFSGSKWPFRIVLVDDLVTSGATVGAMIQLLRQAGLPVYAVASLALASSESIAVIDNDCE